MRLLTFKTATFGSVPGSKVIMIDASPALVAAEVMYRMFGTPLIARSMITSVELTRILALAPGKETETTTLGGATDGNWEIGREVIARPPINKMSSEMTIASAGRCRNFENITGATYSA